jgi:hypothetical protein
MGLEAQQQLGGRFQPEWRLSAGGTEKRWLESKIRMAYTSPSAVRIAGPVVQPMPNLTGWEPHLTHHVGREALRLCPRLLQIATS